MLRLRAISVSVQQLRFIKLPTDLLQELSLPKSPKYIHSRGPIIETYVGKQTNPDFAVLPMPPHKLPQDLKGDMAKVSIMLQSFDFKMALMEKKENFKEELQKEAMIMQNGIKKVIDLFNRRS